MTNKWTSLTRCNFVVKRRLSVSPLVDDSTGKYARDTTLLSRGVDGIRETESGRADAIDERGIP